MCVGIDEENTGNDRVEDVLQRDLESINGCFARRSGHIVTVGIDGTRELRRGMPRIQGVPLLEDKVLLSKMFVVPPESDQLLFSVTDL